MAKFFEFEDSCQHVNTRFKNLALDPEYKGPNVWLHHAVTRKIAKILGDFDLDEFLLTPDWGPGATTLMKRRAASPVNKFQSEIGITRDLYQFCCDRKLLEGYPLWHKRLLEAGFPLFQVGNKIVTVPKDAKTDRVIAIEPGINLWFQMSIGKMIGRRLRRYGIDLRYQSRNQYLAYLGSKTTELATVDLSSASDSISLEVIRELIPPEWFEVMDACRSHFGVQNTSEVVRWNKFSSMGNGFTFQLETLVFYAIALCVCERLHVSSADVSVYGDDVIIPSRCFEAYSSAMLFYGFRVNPLKSHFKGSFRESCGMHYFRGIDVKPLYQRDAVTSVQSVYRLANAVRRLAFREGATLSCSAKYRSVFDYLVSCVPAALRLRIPNQLGDGGFISNLDEATPARCRHGIEGYYVFNLVEVSKTYQDVREGYLINSLWQLEKSNVSVCLSEKGDCLRDMAEIPNSAGGGNTKKAKRNSVQLSMSTIIRIVRSHVQRWEDLGPWL
jgi:hypothetical protein